MSIQTDRNVCTLWRQSINIKWLTLHINIKWLTLHSCYIKWLTLHSCSALHKIAGGPSVIGFRFLPDAVVR